ncbi:hypothetical protein T12_6129 [Trichinella patagoniensis]|uniref:Uncharacterized protein n=1 Tax=Trichinella patagoniensis TaxID=990121 RepID=A0A0V1A554_9BILA|nr:hypothetical protein T12_6129 [Trichinella patagoniensis]
MQKSNASNHNSLCILGYYCRFSRGLVNFHFHVGVLEIDGCVGAAVIDFAISYLLFMKTSYIIYKDSKDPDLSEIMANGVTMSY